MSYCARKPFNFSAVLLLIVLASCSTLSFTYHYADWLLYWKIDAYVEITPEQKPIVSNHLEALQRWHKKEELPRYIRFLEDVKRQWADGLTTHELETIFHDYSQLWKSLVRAMTKEATPLLSSLNRDQIQHLQQSIGQENEELLKEIGTDEHKRMEQRVEKVLTSLEDWIGPLTPEQKLRIGKLVRQLPDATAAWYQNRLRRQDRFIALLRAKVPPIELTQRIQTLLLTPEKGADRAYLSVMQERKAALTPTILAIDGLITPQQRLHATQRLDALILELHEMS